MCLEQKLAQGQFQGVFGPCLAHTDHSQVVTLNYCVTIFCVLGDVAEAHPGRQGTLIHR